MRNPTRLRGRDTSVQTALRSRSLRQPLVEPLEDRRLMAGNFHITSLSLEGGDGVAVVGERITLRTEFTATNLPSDGLYNIRFAVDGVVLTSETFATEVGPSFSYYDTLEGWYASPGPHTIEATIDGDNTVPESDETDNTLVSTFTPVDPSSLPQKLVSPIGGVPNHDWFLFNTIDVDPRPDQASDYRGGDFAREGSAEYGFALPDFTRMDLGVPVFAAADGVVSETQDGNPDRETTRGDRPSNFVRIDHGDGWSSTYDHLARLSIAVRLGQVVSAGQLIGMVGSSGDSDWPQLGFALSHNGNPVETGYSPSSYWADPLPYPGDVPPTTTVQGIGNTTANETEPPSYSTFPEDGRTGDIVRWFGLSRIDPGSTVEVRLYRPDGSLAVDPSFVQGDYVGPNRIPNFVFSPSIWRFTPGAWTVVGLVDDVEVNRQTFEVTAGTPILRVNYAENGQVAPLDFGQVARGGTAPARFISLRNDGSAPLILSNFSLPAGFSLDGPLPASLDPDTAFNLVIRLNTATLGVKSGEVRFDTNDPDTPSFRFGVSGRVSTSEIPGQDRVQFNSPALATSFRSPARVIDSEAYFLSDYEGLVGGWTLYVEIASGGSADDRLAIRNSGPGRGLIGLVGSTVTYGGEAVATVSGGDGLDPLVVTTNDRMNNRSLEALVQSVTYANVSSEPTTTPRLIRMTMLDPTGLLSAPAEKLVINSGQPLTPTAPDVGDFIAFWQGDDLSLTGIGVASLDGGAPTYSWDLNEDGVFGDAVGLEPVLTWSQLVALGIDQFPNGLVSVVLRASDGVHAPVNSSTGVLAIPDSDPWVAAGPDASIPYGTLFAGRGYFDELVPRDWTITVDYGDGSPVQGLAANPDRTFNLSHVYRATGTHEVVVTMSDGLGHEGTDTVSVTVGHAPPAADFDGDGKADLASYRPSGALWLEVRSTAGAAVVPFGAAKTDIPLIGDFDGDGKADHAVYRPSTGQWLILQSAGGGRIVPFGAPDDIPVPADYDGDGKADLALFRPSTAQWIILQSTAGPRVQLFGAGNLDRPIPADYDGDGKVDLAVFRPTTAQWLIWQSSAGPKAQAFGGAGIDVPIPADFDGDGKADFAVFRPGTAQWLILQSAGGGKIQPFGAGTDTPVPADYDGDGKADLAVFRPATGGWFVLQSTAGPRGQAFGGGNLDVPLAPPLAYRYSGTVLTTSRASRPATGAADQAVPQTPVVLAPPSEEIMGRSDAAVFRGASRARVRISPRLALD